MTATTTSRNSGRQSQDPERVLVIGDDTRATLAVVRSLGRAGKEVHLAPFNWHSPTTRSRYVARVHELPRNSRMQSWAEAAAEVLAGWRFDLVIPCCDRGIILIESAPGTFAGQTIARPEPTEAAARLFDKAQTRALAEELGVPVAPGCALGDGASAKSLADALGLPLYLKPRRSYEPGSLGERGSVMRIETHEALCEALSGIAEPSGWLAEAAIPGSGVGYSILAHEGVVTQAFQHCRLREAEAGGSSLRMSEAPDPELGAAVAAMVKRLNFSGVCMFEFRRRPDGRHVLLEANARFWGSLPLPVSLGVDFPLFQYDQIVHGITHPQVAYPAGICARNLLHDARNIGREAVGGHGLLDAARDLSALAAHPLLAAWGRERSDTLVQDDLMPGVLEITGAGRMAINRWRANRAGAAERRATERSGS